MSDTSLSPAHTFSLSQAGLNLLKEVEQLRLKPYDDQTAKDVVGWTVGATIGYGHLIKQSEWPSYKDGISLVDAELLFNQDLAPFVDTVRSKVTTKLTQQQFDALVMLVYNIGTGENGFSGSSVLKLINNPNVITPFSTLESAWKAWNKSQGKVMAGLENRRSCEWDVYTRGIYKKW